MLLLLACADSASRDRIEPSFIELSLGDVARGSEEAPLAFTSSTVSVPVSIRTLGVDQQPYPFDGQLTVNVRPGKLDSESRVTVSGGEWSGEVQFHSAFGSTRIWVTDDLATETRSPGYATGVSDELIYQWPTIAEMQTTTDHETNQLDHEFAELRVSDRQVVVTRLDPAGFWVNDLLDSAYSGLYVYTFNKPDDEIQPGVQIVQLGGIDQEYLASTQLSHATITIGSSTLTVPDPTELDETTACDNDAMEKLEASQVRAANVSIPESFSEQSEEYQDYLDYGQWPIALGACTIYAESTTAAPDFFPIEYAGQTFTRIDGMLKEVYGKWVLVIVDADDIVLASGRPTPRRVNRPKARR